MSKHTGNSRDIKRLSLGLLVSVLALTVGCSADDVMGPGPIPSQSDEPGVTILVDPQSKVTEPMQGTGTSGGAFIVADEGGVVTLGRFRVEIPAGALSEDTEITITRPDPSQVMCELGPHGIQFNEPVTLKMVYGGTLSANDGVDEQNLGIYWFNEATGQWELLGTTVNTANHLLETQLEHFSGYAAAWGQG